MGAGIDGCPLFCYTCNMIGREYYDSYGIRHNLKCKDADDMARQIAIIEGTDTIDSAKKAALIRPFWWAVANTFKPDLSIDEKRVMNAAYLVHYHYSISSKKSPFLMTVNSSRTPCFWSNLQRILKSKYGYECVTPSDDTIDANPFGIVCVVEAK